WRPATSRSPRSGWTRPPCTRAPARTDDDRRGAGPDPARRGDSRPTRRRAADTDAVRRRLSPSRRWHPYPRRARPLLMVGLHLPHYRVQVERSRSLPRRELAEFVELTRDQRLHLVDHEDVTDHPVIVGVG